ncbi:MAG: hypothetical protein C5B58_01490 [Acidobacteria bacterium]|nr:MAG: hypothetical protein C5B58_01490 [Acidobacteriota bacterium]
MTTLFPSGDNQQKSKIEACKVPPVALIVSWAATRFVLPVRRLFWLPGRCTRLILGSVAVAALFATAEAHLLGNGARRPIESNQGAPGNQLYSPGAFRLGDNVHVPKRHQRVEEALRDGFHEVNHGSAHVIADILPGLTLRASNHTNSAALGPLRVSAVNPRFFTRDGVHVVLLVGSHTWADLQDQGTPRPAVFDYDGYMNFMRSHRFNFTQLWTWWFSNGGTAEEGPIRFTAAPFPWRRTGPGNANDGQLKFDFTQLNQGYFDRMRSRIVQAGKNGIYVSIYLFNGYEFQFDVNPNDGNPFEGTNNINGVHCPRTCPTDDSQIPNQVWTYEKNYIHKVIETVNDLNNVIYMVSNESGSPYSDTWEARVIAEIKKYEATKPKRHPVGMGFQYKGGTDSKLYDSKADWVSPNFGSFDGKVRVPPDATGQCPTTVGNGGVTNLSSPNCKAIIVDTDHVCGICGTQTWAWENFMRANSLLFMDPYLVEAPKSRFPSYNNNPAGPCRDGQCTAVDTQWNPIRNAMTDILTYSQKVDLIHMTPQDSLSTSGFCLAKRGSQYLVYSETNSFVLTLVPGTYTYEWFNPSTHVLAGAGSMTIGANQRLTAPFSGDSVLWLHK